MVRLAGNALDECRRRRSWSPAGTAAAPPVRLTEPRRTLHTGADLLVNTKKAQMAAQFTVDGPRRSRGHLADVSAGHGRIPRARPPQGPRHDGQTDHPLSSGGVPEALRELNSLVRTLKRRSADVLAYFDRSGTSNGPTEAINGRFEHLCGSALGFRNLTNYVARSFTGNRRGSDPTYTVNPDEPQKV